MRVCNLYNLDPLSQSTIVSRGLLYIYYSKDFCFYKSFKRKKIINIRIYQFNVLMYSTQQKNWNIFLTTKL